VAIINGGAGAIGRAIDLLFAEAGADIAVCDVAIEGNELKTVAEKIKKLGRRFLAIQVDISEKAQVDNMVQKVIKALGGVDILLNAAANPITRLPLYEVSEGAWDREIDVNLKGYHLCCQAVAKHMIERKKGTIINLATIAAMRAAPMRGAYGVSKAGVVMLTQMLATELGPHNIRVNAIAPGMIQTERTRPSWGDPKAKKQMEENTPLRRLGQAEDIAGPALFLASDSSCYVTGHTLVVDGGLQA